MENKKVISFVISFVVLGFIGIAVLTCSLFEAKADPNPEIPVNWKQTCTEKKWYVFRHYAQTDNSIPEFFTSFSNIAFQDRNNSFTVLINKNDNNIGPFEFVFTSDDTGRFDISQNLTTATVLASFSKENLTLTVPSGKKIILIQKDS